MKRMYLLCALFTACVGPVQNGVANGNCQIDSDGVCECVGSPVVLDLTGDGIQLSSPDAGVAFALSPGHRRTWSWITPGHGAWLVLDRNQNGVIDDGSELFGDYTPQPASATPNGFAALAAYDLNKDGVIDASDPVFRDLRLWTDDNMDGVSQPYELSTLADRGVRAISVRYASSDLTDASGNQFRYSAAVVAAGPVAPVAFDVWLRSQPSQVGLGVATQATTSVTCYAWGYYRNWNDTDICTTQFTGSDPIATNGRGQLSRFVSRQSTGSDVTTTVNRALNIQQAATSVSLYPSDGQCLGYPIFPVPDNFKPPPYYSIYDPYVTSRAKCDDPVITGGGGGGGGSCE